MDAGRQGEARERREIMGVASDFLVRGFIWRVWGEGVGRGAVYGLNHIGSYINHIRSYMDHVNCYMDNQRSYIVQIRFFLDKILYGL